MVCYFFDSYEFEGHESNSDAIVRNVIPFAFNVPDTNCYFQFTTPENSLRLFTSHTGSFFPSFMRFILFISLHSVCFEWKKHGDKADIWCYSSTGNGIIADDDDGRW